MTHWPTARARVSRSHSARNSGSRSSSASTSSWVWSSLSFRVISVLHNLVQSPLGGSHRGIESPRVRLGLRRDGPDHESLADAPVEGTPGTVPPARTQLPQALARPAERASVRVAEQLAERNQLLLRVQDGRPLLGLRVPTAI